MTELTDHHLYWGDFHTHTHPLPLDSYKATDPPASHHRQAGRFKNLRDVAEMMQSARENLDFCTALLYPFGYQERGGLGVETVRQREDFLHAWDRIQELVRTYDRPGQFVVFPGYEWHGLRTRYGDHNVIYRQVGQPLDDAWTLEQLYANVRGRDALVIPHHTGFAVGERGKDWDTFDPDLSPVMEVFSLKGSSEGTDTPFPMAFNSMGPRTTGGTFQAALARGLRVGVIGSNDGFGLHGRWGIGRAAVWARELSGAAIFEAVRARRTYAVTGDRMELQVDAGGLLMGEVGSASGAVDVSVRVRGAAAIDRIELIHNGIVRDTYCHAGTWERQAAHGRRFKVRLEMGGGPFAAFGFKPQPEVWDGHLRVAGGTLVCVEKCFVLPGQHVADPSPDTCSFRLTTAARTSAAPPGVSESLVFEVEGDSGTSLVLQVDGHTYERRINDLLGQTSLILMVEEAKARTRAFTGLGEDEFPNIDVFGHNARKVKFHRAIPESGFAVSHCFENVPLEGPTDYFYVRVSQLNGQMAWSSPIWFEAR